SNKDRMSTTKFPARASSRELIQMLGHANAWWRETAQRLLVERGDPRSIPLLTKCFTSSSDREIKRRTKTLLSGVGWDALGADLNPESAFRRLHALRALSILIGKERGGVGSPAATTPETYPPKLFDRALRVSLLSADPILRENAWRIIAEQHWRLGG